MAKFVNKLAGKNIVIVGGSSGIGFGVAEAVASLDAKLTILSSSTDKISNALSRLKNSFPENKNIEGYAASVTDEDNFVALLQKLSPIDHLVYSAVDSPARTPLDAIDLAKAKDVFNIKLWGAVTSAAAAAKHDVIVPGGSITLTSGTAALKPSANASVWGALNGAVIALTRGLAVDLALKKVRVNTVIPGLVDTELWSKLIPDDNERKETLMKYGEKLLVPFIGMPQDIAEAYVYLMRADYSTGTTVLIDGGAMLS